MSQNPILKAGSASDVINRNKGRVEYGNILGQQMAVEAGILPSVTLQKGGGGSATSRVTSILGASVVTAAERTTAVTNLISNISINATTALRLSAAARGSFGITNVPGAVTATIPGAPTVGTATAGIRSVSLTFTAPTSNGGDTITNYSYSTDGTTYTALSPAQTTSPLTISGLTNGVSYTIRIKAINSVGSGTASSASSSVTPASVDLFSATGTYTTSLANDRKYYRFTGNGTVVIGAAAATVEYFAVGGGGGGGGNNGGGGGGGGLQTNSSRYAKASQSVSISALTAGATYTVTIGSGASPSGGYQKGNQGGNTTFIGTGVSISATGGGGGKGQGGGGPEDAQAGGCGGGGARENLTIPFPSGTQGFDGANQYMGGGGGIGASAIASTGGVGLTYPTGGLTYGAGGTADTSGTSGSTNTGNGGNGGTGGGGGGTGGGSGVFIISYPF
jgi:hypothetical protein